MIIDHYYTEVPGYFDFEEVYREAVASIPDGGTFVEVGSWQGMSLSFFLVEAHRSRKKIKVFAVDHFRGSVNDGPLIEEAGIKQIGAHAMRNLSRANYPFAIIKADSAYGSEFFADQSIDYMFLDASHDYESVVRDLRAYLPKIKPGGIAAGHDFNQWPVQKAVEECIAVRPIEHIDLGCRKWGTCWRVQL